MSSYGNLFITFDKSIELAASFDHFLYAKMFTIDVKLYEDETLLRGKLIKDGKPESVDKNFPLNWYVTRYSDTQLEINLV